MQTNRLTMRPYQAQVIEDIIAAINKGHRRILVVSATGSGKTVIFSELIRRAVKKGNQVLVAVHLEPLVGQTYNKLKGVGIERAGFVKADWPEDYGALVQIASLQTMASRKRWKTKLNPTIIIVDEAHEAAFNKTFRQALDLFPNAYVIGFTATPFRLNKKQGMGDVFEAMVEGPLPGFLMDEGFLVRPRYFSLSAADLTGVRTQGGDYAKQELSVVCNQPEQIGLALHEWFDRADRRRTLGFCVDVAHAKTVAEAFRQSGINAAHVDGETDPGDRKKLYAALRRQDISVLTNCNVLSTGFDEPSVEVGLMLRPTKSISLHFQQLGRLLRISPETGKSDALILDQAGNVARLGRAEDLTADMLSLAPGAGNRTGLNENVKTCPRDDGGCGAVIDVFSQECPHCGHEFKPEAVRYTSQRERLEEILPELNPQLYFQRQFYIGAIRDCYKNQWSPGAATYNFKEQYRKAPSIEITRFALFEHPTPQNHIHYFRHLVRIAKKKQKTKTWVYQYMSTEFGNAWRDTIPNPSQEYEKLIGTNQMSLMSIFNATDK